MFGAASKFIFTNVNGRPADRHLPNGDNAHCTLQPIEWWNKIFASMQTRHMGVPYFILYSSAEMGPDGRFIDYAIDG